MFLKAELSTILKVHRNIIKAMSVFYIQWDVFHNYCNQWDLNKIYKIDVLKLLKRCCLQSL